MSFTVEQKSQLARLMATENLRVEHQKIRTAKFDPINRVLYLPVWQNMTGSLYDLLTGHEVGHALYTPAEGWHSAASDKSKGRHYKHFLNVVEDARIEKKVKRRYPGLRVSFQKAYTELLEQNFFGIEGRDVNELPFIDRLNLFTKSQYTFTEIQFNKEEQELVSKVEKLESWEDVLRVTEEVYAYSKNEQYEIQNQHYEFDNSNEENEDDEFSDDYDFEESDETAGDNSVDEETESDSKSESTDGESEEGEESGENDEEGEDKGSQLNRDKESKESLADQYEPECQTDEAFRSNESQLLNEKCKEYVYVNVPKPIINNIVTPAKRVHELLTEFYKNGGTINRPYGNSFHYSGMAPADSTKFVNEFKHKNDRYIGLLVKEFEMRKAAKSFSKSKLSDTGDIDVSKLSSYKFDDNIFRKVMLTPKGKNHGLVLLLDRSGSMSNNMAGSIEQILVLAMFCRKVNIPFVVYGFGDCVDSKQIDIGVRDSSGILIRKVSTSVRSFEIENRNLDYSDVFLREYLNSSMNNSEFSNAVRNMIILMKSYEGGTWSKIPRPTSENLSNTPLTQAIYATGHIMRDFRKKNNLDITSLIIVHDGDSDSSPYFYEKKKEMNKHGLSEVVTRRVGFYLKQQNVILRDINSKFEYKIDYNEYYDEMLAASLKWFKETTKSKIFGFFITSDRVPSIKSSIRSKYVDEQGKSLYSIKEDFIQKSSLDTLFKKMKEEKFLVSKNQGYDSFYLIAGGNDLKIGEDELDIQGKVTTGKLKNAFMKMNQRKALNRVLVSKFIQGIAA